MKNKLIKKAITVIVGSIISISFGCGAKSKETTTIGDLKIEFLSEFDGMKIYRVTDGNLARFYISDQRACISYDQHSGKTSVPGVIMTGDNTKQEDN